jgi:hypothetical protein
MRDSGICYSSKDARLAESKLAEDFELSGIESRVDQPVMLLELLRNDGSVSVEQVATSSRRSRWIFWNSAILDISLSHVGKLSQREPTESRNRHNHVGPN